MKDGKVFIWMQLLGFERNDEDRGAKRFLEQTGFVPDGACALVFHSDFFNMHRGMDEEYVLPPDNCAYYGIPFNAERERQPWTNYDIRKLADELEKNGTGLYASIFGNRLNNQFHREWITDHPELIRHSDTCGETTVTMFVLKRFKDGTYFEDFFIEKVCQALVDYNMRGIHVGDGFCPPHAGMVKSIEFSTDFIDQFIEHSKVTLAPEIMATMGDDSPEAEQKRSAWIYRNLREEFIEFHAWRWEKFFKKLCDRVHAIGKEVMVLGVYGTDPFETLYCIGIDIKRLVNAGVDRITANPLAASCGIVNGDKYPFMFHRFMAMVPTIAAYLPKGHLVTMLGLQDASEEWNMINHAPCEHERDLYTLMAYQIVDGDGISRASDGYFLCLGDGIPRKDWDWERERLEIALTTKAESIVSPAMYWSDYAFDNMVHEHIHTRRWTLHKHFYEIGKSGMLCGGMVRPEGLKNFNGTLFVPCFDMLSDEEKNAVTAYDRGAVVCTACPDFNPEEYGIKPDFVFSDKFSTYPMTVFAYNCKVSEDAKNKICELISVDDGKPNLEGDITNVPEPDFTLLDTLTFQKVTQGFVDAMAVLLEDVTVCPLKVDKPCIKLRMPDGAYRLYIYNDVDHKYHRGFVKAEGENEIKEAKIISKFPILPPRYMDNSTNKQIYFYGEDIPVKKGFEVKIQPAGVTIVDVYMK